MRIYVTKYSATIEEEGMPKQNDARYIALSYATKLYECTVRYKPDGRRKILGSVGCSRIVQTFH